jgi:acyl-CoA reductase-like NAD-dependent aldehyde dehydrogenase
VVVDTSGLTVSPDYVDSDEEAIELANKSEYGLNAAIHTKDMGRGLRMARQLEYGQVHMNSVSFFNSATGSTGGVKGSGYGRQNSKYGLEEFTQEKFVTWMGKAPTREAFG